MEGLFSQDLVIGARFVGFFVVVVVVFFFNEPGLTRNSFKCYAKS